MVVHLSSCCCGCSLKTGSVTVGVLGAICTLVSLIVCIVLAGGANKLRESSTSDFFSSSSSDYGFTANDVQNVATAVTTGALIFFIVYAVISGVQLILNILLIFGASAEKANLVKPWVVMGVITAVIFGICNVVQVIMIFVGGAFVAGAVLLVVYAVFMCIVVYFILVVNSFHTELISQHITNKI